jgi:hypothetical protein
VRPSIDRIARNEAEKLKLVLVKRRKGRESFGFVFRR